MLQPTRVGNTNPDLTFTRDVQKATWTRLPDTLGSDHHIIEIEVEQAHRSPKMGKARLTDWNAHRQDLDDDSTIEDIEAWLNGIADVADGATTKRPMRCRRPSMRLMLSSMLHGWLTLTGKWR